MRGAAKMGLILGFILLCTIPAAHAGPQQCEHAHCKWDLVVTSATRATSDLYPAGDSRADCERLAAQAPPDRDPDVTIACVEESQLDAWYRDHVPDPWPAK